MADDSIAQWIADRLRHRNVASRRFFEREADRLAAACHQMSERFQRGGRLLAFGRGPYATDAQHVSVEFVHPVIVGKRALPALDLSLEFRRSLPALVRADDMAMAFGPPGGDAEALEALAEAGGRGAMTFALPAARGSGSTFSYAVEAPSVEPFVHQELIEVLDHTLWETVHVYLEHRGKGRDAGAASFLYPFLGSGRQDTKHLLGDVAASIRAKAVEDERLREQVATEQAHSIAAAVLAIRERVASGGCLFLFGNGGSATDANDWVLDCVLATAGGTPIPAVSLATEPANLSAIANDIGAEAIFLRQLIAQVRPIDAAIAISTSGGSRNVIAALEEARKRGLLTIALLGYDGGEVVRSALADHAIVVRCDYIPRIQEIQASIYHAMLETHAALDRGDRVAVASEQDPESAAVAHVGTELYGSASCPFTGELRAQLEWEGRAFVEHDVERDPRALERLLRLAAASPARVPVLVVDGAVVEIGWQGRSCLVGAGGSCDVPPRPDDESRAG